MESEKVKKIKEYLQEEVFIATKFEDKLRRIPTRDLQTILTLINELESENKMLVESCKNCHYIKDLEIANGHAKELKDRIAELEKGNEALSFAVKQGFNDCQKKALKQFAERLKDRLRFTSPTSDVLKIENLIFDGIEVKEVLDETLKEFINEKPTE